jgi:glutathione S-transferase
METAMPKLTLISHDLCPYVQRAMIALTEKGVAFDRVYIDLAAKPDWFLAMSPLGKVPLLKVGDDVIFESAVILEYLEETQPNPLHPADPVARARHRAMIEFGSAILSDIWGLEIAATRDVAEAKIAGLRQRFARLEQELGDGPWFAGEKFSLVDAAFAPVFRYFGLFDRILDHGICAYTPKVAAWRSALAARASIRDAVVADYNERLERFVAKQDGYLAALLMKRAA